MNWSSLTVLMVILARTRHVLGDRIDAKRYKRCSGYEDLFERYFKVAEERSKVLCSSSCERDPGCHGITFHKGKCYKLMDSGGSVLVATIAEIISSPLFNPNGLNAICLSEGDLALRTPNFTLTFDGGDDPAYGQNNAEFGPQFGRIGNGTQLTLDNLDWVELDAGMTDICPLTLQQCASGQITHAFWAKIRTPGNWINHLMANNFIRYWENSGTIEYYQWYLPDGSNQQKYEFTMSDFDKYDQWIHLVVTFKPDGTNDALHFYINGIEMDINVVVSAPVSGTKTVNRLVFGTHNVHAFDAIRNARWYFDEFYAWDVVLTPHEVYLLYITFPEA